MATAVKEKEPITPVAATRLPWHEDMRMKFRAAVSHTFLLTGNVRDFADNRLFLHRYIYKMFLDPVKKGGKSNFDLIVCFDLAQGISFPSPDMADKFVELAMGKDSKKENKATAGVFETADEQVKIPRDPKSALGMIERVLKFREDDPDRKGAKRNRTGSDGREMHTLVLIDFAESIFPAGNWGQLNDTDRSCIVKLLHWAQDETIRDNGNPIILIGESGTMLHSSVTASGSRVEQLELMLPNPAERLAYIEEMEEQLREDGEALQYEAGFDKHKFAHVTAGLKKSNIEDIKLSVMHRGEKIGAAVVKYRKREMFKSEYQSVLQVVDPEFGFDVVGGYQWLKDYFRNEVVAPMLSGDYKRVPQGCLFVGPPGTGKSLFAQGLAYEAHLNMVELSIGKLMGSLVGQSEHNMEKALLAIRSLTPVLVWMDEIDQSITRGSQGDSGVSNRLFKMLLEFMADTTLRGKVLFCAATNRPDMMDPALKRRGRFDKIIPFVLPDAAQRRDIIPAVVKRYGYKVEKGIDYDWVAKNTTDWVGSDIEAAVVKAYQVASRDGDGTLTDAVMKKAFKLVIPANSNDVKMWANLALAEVSDLELLPPDRRESYDRAVLDKEIRLQAENSTSLLLDRTRRKDRGDII